MKRFLIFLFLILAGAVEAQTQSYITAVITVTNTAAGSTTAAQVNQTFAVNGHTRTWVATVTSANNQIAVTNAISTVTNLFNSFVIYPETVPWVAPQWLSSNTFQLVGMPGNALTIFTNWPGGSTQWVSWVLYTNTITNAFVLRAPTNAIGAYEQTNTETALIAYLSDNKASTYVLHASPYWVQFLGTNFGANLTNFILTLSTNSTNFTLSLGTNSTNFTLQQIFSSSNYCSNIFSYFTNALTGLQPGCAALTNFCAAFPSGLFPALSYQDTGNVTGNTANIYLTNTTGMQRVLIVYGGTSTGSFGPSSFFNSAGSLWLYNDASDDTTIRDQSGSSFNRFEADDGTVNGGETYLTSWTHNMGLKISGVSDNVTTFKPVSQNLASFGTTDMGTATNFTVTVGDTGTSETALNSFSIPGNTFTNVGDSMIRTTGLTFTGAGTYEVKVYAFGDTVFDTGTFTVASSGAMSVTAEVSVSTTGSGGVLACNCSAIGTGTSTTVFSQVTSKTGVDLTSSGLCKIGLAGAGTGDGQVLLDNVRFAPSSVWTTIP